MTLNPQPCFSPDKYSPQKIKSLIFKNLPYNCIYPVFNSQKKLHICLEKNYIFYLSYFISRLRPKRQPRDYQVHVKCFLFWFRCIYFMFVQNVPSSYKYDSHCIPKLKKIEKVNKKNESKFWESSLIIILNPNCLFIIYPQ